MSFKRRMSLILCAVMFISAASLSLLNIILSVCYFKGAGSWV